MLTAREWILLPKSEQEKRKHELSKEECRKLRLELSMVHFTEEEKMTMSEEAKRKFTHAKERTAEEKEDFNKKVQKIFKEMQEEVKIRTTSQ